MTNRMLPVEHHRPDPGPIRTVITTCGEIHGPLPSLTRPTAVIDLRRKLRNPADDPRLIHMTGLDEAVRRHVLDTPGAHQVIEDAIGTILAAYAWAQSQGMRQDGLVICRGGRHRAVVIGEMIAAGLRIVGHGTEVEHRDIDKPAQPGSGIFRGLRGARLQIGA